MRTMPFLPTLVHISSIMVGSSELNSTIPIHFSSQILKKSVCNLAISCLTLSNLTWFMDLTFQVPVLLYSIRLYFQHQYIHCWLSVPLWPSCVTLSGAISNCPLLFPSSIEDTFWSGKGGGGLIFWCRIFCLFILFMVFLQQEYWSRLPFPLLMDHVLLELSLWPVLDGPAWHGS